MEYIILAYIVFCIFYSTMAITLCRTLKRSKQADSDQNTHCRVCNVLLFEHNHSCELERSCNYDCEHCDTREGCHTWLNRDLERSLTILPIQEAETVIINKKEVNMLSNYTQKDTDNLSEIEKQLLMDYFRFREVVNQIKADYPHLITEYEIENKPKRTRKAKEAQTDIEDWQQINFTWLKTGRNKLGGGTCRISASKLTQKSLDRMWDDYNQAYGVTEREQLVSKCPKCNGHFRTTFERGDELVQDEEDNSRMVRLQFTRYTCDDCGHTLTSKKSGEYLVKADYDMVANSIPSKPIYDSENGYNNDRCDPELSETEIDEIENEPQDELYKCPACKQMAYESELDEGNCPTCGATILEPSYVN